MTVLKLLLCFGASAILMAAQDDASAVGTGAAIGHLMSRAHLEFALDLYRVMADTTNATGANRSDINLLFSPYSVSSAIAILYLGAAGNTSSELRAAMHLENLSYPVIHRGYKRIVERLHEASEKFNLSSGSAIFPDKALNVSPNFAEILSDYYNATLHAVDFVTEEESARDAINEWAEAATQGKIQTLVDSPLSPSTRLLLVTALHLSGYWQYQFDPAQTAENGLFHVGLGFSVSAPLMSGFLRVPYGSSIELSCSVLELPFVTQRLSLFVVLPDDLDGLPALEQILSPDALRHLLATIQTREVQVKMPRLRLSSRLDLSEPLSKMGLQDLFQAGSVDLSGLAPDDPSLCISTILHRAMLEVSEAGAEAAAASALGVQRIGTVEEAVFDASHPFLFFIWDYQTSVVLLMGRVNRPDLQSF